MDNLSNLVPYVILAIISGCINAFVAWQKLQKRCRYFLFYQPLKTVIFWIWLLMQIVIPAVFFWFMVIEVCSEKPSLNIQLITDVLVYGIFFQVFSDTTETLGITAVNVIIPLTWFDRFFYDEVKAKQRRQITDFWHDLRQELKQKTDLSSGINYLKDDYFDRLFLGTEQEYQYFQNKLAEIKQESDINLQSKELISTCFKGIIPRQDLPEILKKFNLSQNFIHHYFK
jgi:hypothetical protein